MRIQLHRRIVAASALICLSLNLSGESSDEIKLGEGEDSTILVDPDPDFRQSVEDQISKIEGREPTTLITRVRLVQVTVGNGNNPFNPQEPIDNEDGVANPSTSGGGDIIIINACNLPATVPYAGVAPDSFVNPTIGSASFGLNLSNLACDLATGSSASNPALFFDVNLDPSQGGLNGCSTDPSQLLSVFGDFGNGFEIEMPTFFTTGCYALNQIVTFTFRHTASGRRFEIEVLASDSLSGGITVISFTEL